MGEISYSKKLILNLESISNGIQQDILCLDIEGVLKRLIFSAGFDIWNRDDLISFDSSADSCFEKIRDRNWQI